MLYFAFRDSLMSNVKSVAKSFSHVASWGAIEMDKISASTVDNADSLGLVLFQLIAPPWDENIYPVTDLGSSIFFEKTCIAESFKNRSTVGPL